MRRLRAGGTTTTLMKIPEKLKKRNVQIFFFFYPDTLKLSDPKRIVQVTKLRTTKVNENNYSGNYFIRN